jgi:hypothetical protein
MKVKEYGRGTIDHQLMYCFDIYNINDIVMEIVILESLMHLLKDPQELSNLECLLTDAVMRAEAHNHPN